MFRFVDRVSLIESYAVREIVKDSNLTPQRDFEFLEPFRLPMRIAAGFHHGLMRIANCFDIFGQSFPQDFRFACLDGIAGEAEQDFGYRDIAFGAIDGIRESTELVFFSLETFEAFVVLAAKGSGMNCARTESNDNQH